MKKLIVVRLYKLKHANLVYNTTTDLKVVASSRPRARTRLRKSQQTHSSELGGNKILAIQ